MKRATQRLMLFGSCLLVLVCVFATVKNEMHRSEAEIYKSFSSPDDHFKLVVYRTPIPTTMPGQSGDAPGYVQLQNAVGNILQEKKVEMVQIIETPVWSKTNVEIKLFADWNLPN